MTRFSLDRDRLMYRSDESDPRGDEQLLVGPVDHLSHFAEVLNAADPEDSRIAPVLRRLISATRDCSFAPGERLLADDTPMTVLTKHRKGESA